MLASCPYELRECMILMNCYRISNLSDYMYRDCLKSTAFLCMIWVLSPRVQGRKLLTQSITWHLGVYPKVIWVQSVTWRSIMLVNNHDNCTEWKLSSWVQSNLNMAIKNINLFIMFIDIALHVFDIQHWIICWRV